MLFTRPELATEPSIEETSVRLSILPIRLNIDQVGRREEGGGRMGSEEGKKRKGGGMESGEERRGEGGGGGGGDRVARP